MTEKTKAADILAARKHKAEVEAFTIVFNGKDGTGTMVLAWENTAVKVPLKY